MKFIEKIYNYDNITPDKIDEVTTRARAILINSNDEVLMCYSNTFIGIAVYFSKE